MGALLRFERETGKNAMLVLSPENLRWGLTFSDVGTLMWACTASATKAAGRDFEMSCLDFLDACPPEIAEKWLTAALTEQQGGSEEEADGHEKKSPTA